jgi:hypothetical protein
VYQVGTTGITGVGRIKTVIIPGYAGPNGAGIPAFVIPGATIDLDIANNQFYGALADNFSIARIGSNATDLLPTSASGASFQTFGPNTFRITAGLGLLVEESRINYLLNSTAPATQTTQSLATGTYTLWVNGSGSAAVSAGTATITGAGTATNGTPVVFVVTVAGTVTVTVSGSLNAFQLELGGATIVYGGSSLIITGGTIGVRAADQVVFTGTAFNIVSSIAFSAILTCKRPGPNFNIGSLIGSTLTGAYTLQDHDAGNQISQSLNNVTFLVKFSVPQMTSSVFRKVGMTVQSALNALKVEGGTLTTNATATSQVADTLYGLGNKGSGTYVNGYYSRITMFATPLTSSVLNGLV